MFTPISQFEWYADNFADTYTETGFGTNVPGNASANAYGADTSLLVGIAQDCYGIAIGFSNGNTSGATRRNHVDLLIDQSAGVGNAGSSWSSKITRLYVNSASMILGGYWYYFPLYLAAGTAIGAKNQSTTASTSALRMGVRVYGKPKRPELLRVGQWVQTLGASAGATSGQSITPATGAMGDPIDFSINVGTLNLGNAFWFQAGMGFSDTNRANNSYFLDVLYDESGGGATFLPCAHNIMMVDNSVEQSGKNAFGISLPIREVPDGSSINVNAAASITPESSATVIAYACGG